VVPAPGPAPDRRRRPPGEAFLYPSSHRLQRFAEIACRIAITVKE
jgi:hypothetical protein